MARLPRKYMDNLFVLKNFMFTLSRVALATLVCLIPLSAKAEIERFSCRGKESLKAEVATRLMKESQQWYREHHSLAARFVQHSFLAALDIAETSSGSVWFTNKGTMRWKYEEPEPQDFLIRDNTLWYYRPNDSQLIIDTFETLLVSDLPVAFMMGLGNLERDFNFVSGCVLESETRLVLAPAKKEEKEQAAGIGQLVLLLGKGAEPKGAQIGDISGNLTAIELVETTTNKDLKEDLFSADFPDGIYILDRRIKQ